MYILVSLQYPLKIITRFQFYSCSFQRSVIISPHFKTIRRDDLISKVLDLEKSPLAMGRSSVELDILINRQSHCIHVIVTRVWTPNFSKDSLRVWILLSTLPRSVCAFTLETATFRPVLSIEHHYPDQEWKTVHDLKLWAGTVVNIQYTRDSIPAWMPFNQFDYILSLQAFASHNVCSSRH